jgi:AcrR family transcriptional regulator
VTTSPDQNKTGRPPDEEGARSNPTAEALLDATERLLAAHGPSVLTTRRIAEEAGQAHGLIRYYFGSVEELMILATKRAAQRILTRQRALYAGEGSFVEKWRTAMAYLETDLRSETFPKLAAELLALGWNEPAYRTALREMMEGFTDMLSDAVRKALEEFDVGPVDVEAIATLIRTFQLGILVERLAGVDTGHGALLQVIDEGLARLPRRKKSRPRRKRGTRR